MRRRGQNEGSIFRRKDGRWCGQINLGWENGRRKRKSYYGATAAEVREALLKARSDQSHNLPVAVERQTVAQFLTRWLEHSLKPRARDRTIESFGTIIEKHIIPEIGRIQIDKLTPQDVQGLLSRKSKSGGAGGKGLSAQTVVNIHTVLRSALNQAVKWETLARNVAELANPPRIKRPKANVLTAEQSRALIDAARDQRFEGIYVLALTLGMRRGEILGLSWVDVDLDNRNIRISHAMQRLASGLSITEVKTERSQRMVTMPESVVRVLKSRRVRQLEERLKSGLKWCETGLVFTNPNGGPLEPITVHRDYKRLLKAADLSEQTRFHDLRHSAASLLLAQGVQLRVIMELLGHSSISLTANTYAHVMPPAMRDAADKMDAIFGS